MGGDHERRPDPLCAAEKAALVEFEVRAFVITNSNLSAEAMARRVISATPKMVEICEARPGPFLFALHANRVDEIRLGA